MMVYKAYILNEGGELPPKYFLYKKNYLAYKRTMRDVGIVLMVDTFETEDELDG